MTFEKLLSDTRAEHKRRMTPSYCETGSCNPDESHSVALDLAHEALNGWLGSAQSNSDAWHRWDILENRMDVDSQPSPEEAVEWFAEQIEAESAKEMST